MNALYGWYVSGSTVIAEMMPDPNAPCVVCCRPLDSEQTKVVGDLNLDGDPRTYFFRVHEECSKKVPKKYIEDLVFCNIVLDKLSLVNVQRPISIN